MTAPITEEELEQTRKLAEAATEGPWEQEDAGEIISIVEPFPVVAKTDFFESSLKSEQCWSNGDYIAFVHPERTLRMVAEIKRLRSALERVTVQVTSEEYLAECGEDMDPVAALEVCDAIILEARQALAGEDKNADR